MLGHIFRSPATEKNRRATGRKGGDPWIDAFVTCPHPTARSAARLATRVALRTNTLPLPSSQKPIALNSIHPSFDLILVSYFSHLRTELAGDDRARGGGDLRGGGGAPARGDGGDLAEGSADGAHGCHGEMCCVGGEGALALMDCV